MNPHAPPTRTKLTSETAGIASTTAFARPIRFDPINKEFIKRWIDKSGVVARPRTRRGRATPGGTSPGKSRRIAAADQRPGDAQDEAPRDGRRGDRAAELGPRPGEVQERDIQAQQRGQGDHGRDRRHEGDDAASARTDAASDRDDEQEGDDPAAHVRRQQGERGLHDRADSIGRGGVRLVDHRATDPSGASRSGAWLATLSARLTICRAIAAGEYAPARPGPRSANAPA